MPNATVGRPASCIESRQPLQSNQLIESHQRIENRQAHPHRKRSWITPATTLLACLASTVFISAYASAEDSAQRLLNADSEPQNWLTYGRTYSEQRYSPLDQINRSNVGAMKLAWSYDFDSNRGQEATPLVVDGVMYATTNWSKLKALDAATGKLLWAFDPHVPGNIAARGCCDTVNRGAAYWDGKIYFGTFDGRLIAVDAKTGKQVWSVDTIPKDAALGDIRSYTVDGAPRIAKGIVMIGNGGAELGARGFVSGFDTATGKLRWRFFTTPNAKNEPDHAASDSILMSKAYGTWTAGAGWTKSGGGGTVWDSIVYDPITDLVYLGVGNGAPWNYMERSDGKGDNLFLGSIVAIKPETGEYVWHFQETPQDQWDYTSVQQIMTMDMPIKGVMRHVIVHAPKNGFFYILDAKTGEFLSGTNYVPVNWAKGLDPKTGRPNTVPEALYSVTGKPWAAFPGSLGGHNWAPMSYSPKTKLVYIPAQELPQVYAAVPDQQRKIGYNLGVSLDSKTINVNDPKQVAAVNAAQKGYLLAWDPNTQKEAFRVDHKGPWNGGTLATGGDLVFQGLATGFFYAYDATNGKQLFEFPAQGGIIAPPITYSVGGKQYVALEVGWGGAYPLAVGAASRPSGWTVNHSRMIVFALDGKAKLPPQNDAGFLPVKPTVGYDAAKATKGYAHFEQMCSVCHGGSAQSGGVLPDLRWSGAILDPKGFYNVVGNGALTAYGMIAFKDVLNPEEIEELRNFILKQATDTYQQEEDARQGRQLDAVHPVQPASK